MEIDRRTFIKTSAAATLGKAAAEIRSVQGGHPFSGVYAALFTPFTAEGRVNPEMVERMVEYGISSGLSGFYLTGGTGEGLSMSREERAEVYRAAVRAGRGRVRFIAHVGAASTIEAAALARDAAAAGCDWVSSVPPVSFAAKPEEVMNHYRIISEATDLPFMIYAANGVIDPERDARIFDLRNVKGMKYTGTNFYDVWRLKARIGKEAVFFSGSDQHFLPALACGGVFSGSIGTLQNVIPAHFVRIWHLAERNDFRTAAALQVEVNRAVQLVCHTFPKQSLRKAAMRYIGLDCGMFRPPHAPYSEAEYADFCARADALGVFGRSQAI